MKNDKIKCKRCGNCCRGMIWRKRFGFDEITEMMKKKYITKKQMEEILIEERTNHLEKIGIPIRKTYPVKWDANERRATVYVRGGRCNQLKFNDNKKSSMCLRYDNRPKECKGFFCKKSRQRAALDKIIKEKSKNTQIMEAKNEKICNT